ncbi:MAG TPA: hypothetical protein VKK79_15310 [Candidatus Lokiarchaeia archaeon]|nr:hypothetical protein [Candidatus Lokiarchaeia archaeon]
MVRKRSGNVGLVDTLIVIGVIIVFIEEFFNIMGGGVLGIILAVVGIVLGVILLGSIGVINTRISLSAHWIITLLFGILYIVWLGALWGGVVLVIAAIVEIIYAL